MQERLAALKQKSESLEAELAAEREAHESTCRDAEAAILEVSFTVSSVSLHRARY